VVSVSLDGGHLAAIRRAVAEYLDVTPAEVHLSDWSGSKVSPPTWETLGLVFWDANVRLDDGREYRARGDVGEWGPAEASIGFMRPVTP
jgi:hypothetical protein